MELSSTNTEKILIFSQKRYIFSKENFSYISGNETLHFSTQAQRIKKSTPRKISYALGNRSPEKISYVFSKESFFYISGNGIF